MLMMTASALIIPQSEISLKTPAVPQGACLLLKKDNPIIIQLFTPLYQYFRSNWKWIWEASRAKSGSGKEKFHEN